MTFNPDIHHRRSIRLPHHDYAGGGCYFVTVCTYRRAQLFGDIVEGEMRLSDYGAIADSCWREIPEHFPHVGLGEFVVMPNHLHGLLMLSPFRQRTVQPRTQKREFRLKAGSLGAVVGSFKSVVTKHVNILREAKGTPLWQRDYYEHVVRNEADLERIQDYVRNNPQRWWQDQLHPENPSKW